MKLISDSPTITKKFGKVFSKVLTVGDVVVLEGELGAGKTTFIKGVLGGLRFDPQKVKSPSFTLMRHYPCRNINVYHIDLYRIERFEELANVGFDDYLYNPQGLTLVEWGQKIDEALPRYFQISLSFAGVSRRIIDFSWKGRR